MRWWGVLFGLIAALCVGCFAYAPLETALWLPAYEETNAGSLAALDRLQVDSRTLEARLDEARGGGDLAEIRVGFEAMLEPIRGLIDGQFLSARSAAMRARVESVVRDLGLADAATDEASRAAALKSASAATGLLRRELADARREVGASGSVAPSTAAAGIDHLFIVILWITGVTFVLTMAALVWCVWRFAAVPGRAAVYSHGSLPVEIGLAVAAAVPLVFITIYQLEDWAALKFRDRRPEGPPIARVTGYQFGWRMRYPGADGAFETADDLVRINELHFVKDEPTLIELDSEDVIHSFSLPQLRVKQDAMPGLRIPVWFDASRAGRYELLCAELCGWGHYKMRADVLVHETRAEFEAWQAAATAAQDRDQPDDPEAE